MMPPVSENTALLLDIDGTLLDMARKPDLVKVPRELVRVLEALSRQLSGALAFVSGRSLESIDKLFAPFRPAAIGAHGGEMRSADGSIRREPPLSDAVRAIFTGLAMQQGKDHRASELGQSREQRGINIRFQDLYPPRAQRLADPPSRTQRHVPFV